MWTATVCGRGSRLVMSLQIADCKMTQAYFLLSERQIATDNELDYTQLVTGICIFLV
jgi:hypothetical protein